MRRWKEKKSRGVGYATPRFKLEESRAEELSG